MRHRLVGRACAGRRSPRPLDGWLGASGHRRRTSSIVHGNGERASTTSPCRDSSVTNERLDQWLRWPGVLPRSSQVRAAGHVQPAPQRLARDARRAASAARAARHLGDACAPGRARARAPRSPSPRRTRRRRTAGSRPSSRGTRGSAPGAVSHSACSCGSSRSMPTTRRSPRRCAHFVVEHALAAADVEQRLRAPPARTARRACARSRPSGGGRPGSSSRTCRTCCR